jgi:hypothetical protein
VAKILNVCQSIDRSTMLFLQTHSKHVITRDFTRQHGLFRGGRGRSYIFCEILSFLFCRQITVRNFKTTSTFPELKLFWPQDLPSTVKHNNLTYNLCTSNLSTKRLNDKLDLTNVVARKRLRVPNHANLGVDKVQ